MIRSVLTITCLSTLSLWQLTAAQEVYKDTSCDEPFPSAEGPPSRRLQSSDEPCKAASCDFDKFPALEPEPTGSGMRALAAMAEGPHRLRTTEHRRLVGTMLSFEGVRNLVPVDNTYAADGFFFSPNAYGLVDSDVPGTGAGSGNIGGLPSPDTVMFFFAGSAIVVNIPAGCELGVSFWYSAVYFVGTVSAFDGLDGTGNLLGTMVLPLTPESGAPDPTGVFSPMFCDRLEFGGNGVARSLSFGGVPNQIVFDDIKCGTNSMPQGWHD